MVIKRPQNEGPGAGESGEECGAGLRDLKGDSGCASRALVQMGAPDSCCLTADSS